jgi:hypothetical protein
VGGGGGGTGDGEGSDGLGEFALEVALELLPHALSTISVRRKRVTRSRGLDVNRDVLLQCDGGWTVCAVRVR